MIGRDTTFPRHYFIYNGKNSADYGVFISGNALYDTPTREIEVISVPGRNGDIIFDNRRFTNVEVTYPCYIPRGFNEKFNDFKAAILSDTKYHRLEDTYSPEHFREGFITGPIQVTTGPFNKSGQFDITFNCKPQRFLKLGERALTITTSGSSLHNRTDFPSKPLIQVIGESGGDGMIEFVKRNPQSAEDYYTVNFENNPTGIFYLDSESGIAYYENTSGGVITKIPINDRVQAQSTGFPQIAPGYNTITFYGDVTRLQIQPRWWTI